MKRLKTYLKNKYKERQREIFTLHLRPTRKNPTCVYTAHISKTWK